MNENEDCPTILLKISYPDNYPESEGLQIEFDDEETEFESEDLKELSSCLDLVMEENACAVMTFMVISAAIEWLEGHHERVQSQKAAREAAKKEAEEAILQVKRLFHFESTLC